MFKSVILFSLILTVCAQANDSKIFDISATVTRAQSLLNIQIVDSLPVANACDYHVQRFEFINSLKTILIDLASDDCKVDRFGRRQANVHWVLPQSMRGSGDLCIVINREKMGTIRLNPSLESDLFISSKCELAVSGESK